VQSQERGGGRLEDYSILSLLIKKKKEKLVLDLFIYRKIIFFRK
jgi:hypothetical protein